MADEFLDIITNLRQVQLVGRETVSVLQQVQSTGGAAGAYAGGVGPSGGGTARIEDVTGTGSFGAGGRAFRKTKSIVSNLDDEDEDTDSYSYGLKKRLKKQFGTVKGIKKALKKGIAAVGFFGLNEVINDEIQTASEREQEKEAIKGMKGLAKTQAEAREGLRHAEHGLHLFTTAAFLLGGPVGRTAALIGNAAAQYAINKSEKKLKEEEEKAKLQQFAREHGNFGLRDGVTAEAVLAKKFKGNREQAMEALEKALPLVEKGRTEAELGNWKLAGKHFKEADTLAKTEGFSLNQGGNPVKNYLNAEAIRFSKAQYAANTMTRGYLRTGD